MDTKGTDRTTRRTRLGRRVRLVGALGAAVALGLGLSACGSSSANPTTTTSASSTSSGKLPSSDAIAGMSAAQQAAYAVKPPAIKQAVPLPGPIAKTAALAKNVLNLDVTPQAGLAGQPMTITGKGLAKDKAVELTWSTADDTWSAQIEPNTVNYLGRVEEPLTVVLANTKTNASGDFSVTLKAPNDWGGIHDIYAVVNGVDVAHGGFLINRSVSMSPKSGPVGTPITITYTGLGDSLYTGGFSLLWDNHYVGEGMSTWTRGTATFTIRAAGPVGNHTIQIGNAISYLYLNVPQSPIPYTTGYTLNFDTTADDGPPAPSITWPESVAPSVTARTTLAKAGLAASSNVKMGLGSTSGAVLTKVPVTASGFSSDKPVQLVWSTVVGNRVDCKSICWQFVSQQLGTVTPSKGSISTSVTVPDGLGGWHAIQLVQGGKIWAQQPFYVHASIVGQGLSSITVKEGQAFTIHLKGVGWTQLDNTFAVDYDNSYVGYACGFNSNGDVLLHLYATGAPGTHIIDLYPMLYSLSPSFAGAEYGMVPVLTFADDEPGLALGYQLPSMHFAITVVS